MMEFLDIISYWQYLLPFDLNSFATFIVFTIVTGSLYWYLTIPKNLPPGPLGVPILGSLPFLGKQPHIAFNEMAKKYGQVFSVYLGSRLVIVLNDYEAMKEALINQSDKFWSRPQESPFQFPEERNDMPADDDTIWKTHRRFNLKTLRDFGVGKNAIEDKIMEEIQYFLREYDKKEGKPFDPKNDIDTSIANNICSILFGKRFEYDDEAFLDLKQSQQKVIEIAGGVTVYLFLPWARYIPGLSVILKRNHIKAMVLRMRDFVKNEWNAHIKSYDEKNTNDYTSAFMAERQKLKDNNQDASLFVESVYCDEARGLFGAGMETSATLLKWSIIYLINYPEKQRKVQQEIDTVIGQDRKPQWNDRLRTPYVEAFMMEVHRIVTLVPLNVPHSNVSEATLYGYQIPKRSYIVSNLWNVLHDPKYWDKPDEFKPERFISKDNELVKPEFFIPFSIGKHSCVGEGLAKMELYLYFASLLQRFTFEAEPGNLPRMESSSSGLVNTTPPFKAIIKRRR